MPWLDLSDVLTDPDLGDVFDVQRRIENVTGSGLSSLTPDTITKIPGIVQPVSPEELSRRNDVDVQKKTISIITRFALFPSAVLKDGTSYKPDIITWNGNQFMIASLEDWSRFGQGFTKATCQMIDSNQLTPRTRGFPE